MKRVLRQLAALVLLALICCIAPSTAWAADVSNNIDKPKVIEVNKAYTQTFEKKGDVDCYKFKTGGGKYKLVLTDLSGRPLEAFGTIYDFGDDYTFLSDFGVGMEYSYGEYHTFSSAGGDPARYQMGSYMTGWFSPDITSDGKPVMSETIDIGSHKAGKEVGIWITGDYKGKYKFKVVGKRYVVRKSIKKATVTVASPTYSGLALKPKVTVKLGSKTLKSGTDYSLTFSKNINAGSNAVVKVTGKGDYKDTVSKKFTIKRRPLSNSVQITLKATSFVYSGKPKKPSFSIYLPAANAAGMVTMQNKVDYTYKYENNVQPGTAKLVVTGKGNFMGTTTRTFKIEKLKQPAALKSAGTTVTYEKIGKTVSVGITGRKEFAQISYSTSNAKVATVSSKGVVTFRGGGTADITVKLKATEHYKAKKLTYNVTVLKQQKIATSVKSGAKITCTSKTVPLGAKLTAGNGKLTYKSSDTSVVKVDSSGNLYFSGINKVGVATITITAARTSAYAKATKEISITTVKGKPVLSCANMVQEHDVDEGSFSLGVASSEAVQIEYWSDNPDLVSVKADGTAVINPDVTEDASTIVHAKSNGNALFNSSNELKITIAISCADKLYWPVRDANGNPITELSSVPGQLVYGNAHRGIDIANAAGASWYAAHEGEVVYVFRGCVASGGEDHAYCSPSHPEMKASANDFGTVCNNGFGNGCIIKSIIDGRVFYFQYAHMDSVSDNLVEGMTVQKGAYLGKVGNRGFSFGIHAHFEIDEETSPGSYWGRSTDNNPFSDSCEFKYSL